MYDTVFLNLRQEDAEGVDFLEYVPYCLDDVSEHYYGDVTSITGSLEGLKVTAMRTLVKVRDGSLCKFLLGDNYQSLGRHDTKLAIEKLSDLLHLPMDRAKVVRMDVAQNLIMRFPTSVYFEHLGMLRFGKRLVEPNGLYYALSGGRLCFYDKNHEQGEKKEYIPDLYQGRNVLRYEKRSTNRIAANMGVPIVTGALLYDEAFYMSTLNGWKSSYQSIQKINDVNLNFDSMKTKQQLYKMGILSLVEQAGGQIEIIKQINEAQKRGELTNKQAYDLRLAINEACSIREGLVVPNEAIQELDKKIAEAIMYYR